MFFSKNNLQKAVNGAKTLYKKKQEAGSLPSWSSSSRTGRPPLFISHSRVALHISFLSQHRLCFFSISQRSSIIYLSLKTLGNTSCGAPPATFTCSASYVFNPPPPVPLKWSSRDHRQMFHCVFLCNLL